MVRKTKEDAEATRAGILDAAEQCFLQKGVARTTLEDIAARAGHTRGAVYWHFANKLEVFEAVMERVESPLLHELDQITTAVDTDLLGALRRFYANAFEEFVRNPHARNGVEISLLHCELADETRPIMNREQGIAAQTIARVTEALTQAKRLKHLRPQLDPAHCSMILHCCTIGLLREWVLRPDAIDLSRDGMAMVETLLSGFATDLAIKPPRRSTSAPSRARHV